jgi:ATPase family protein associated with various cellular activities (AAA)
MEEKLSEPRSIPPFGFEQLASLRLLCRQIQQEQSPSLRYFEFEEGYQHYLGKNKISVSSTATCVLSLVATGAWVLDERRTKANTRTLIKKLVEKKKSAGLEDHNPFTEAWILDAVSALAPYSDAWDEGAAKSIEEKEAILQKVIGEGQGGVNIAQYPASPYLTQLVVRALRRRGKLVPQLEQLVSEWSWRQLTRELSLAQTKSKSKDPFAFAYLLMLVTSVTPVPKISPERSSIQRAALEIVFDSQLPDGTWPLSRPLFHYPNFGNAYCYDYEMLTQLLLQPELEEALLDYLPKLSLAAKALASNAYRLAKGGRAWASGHHPQLEDPEKAGPESWTTASVYHFIHRLDRLVAEAVRRVLFRHLDQPLPPSIASGPRTFDDIAPAPDFLDSRLEAPGSKEHSLRGFLWEKFVQPLSVQAGRIAEGVTFEKGTATSAIFFGPPGTSKTELSKKIAEFLDWPLLLVDPSLLLRTGMDGMQAEANKIFRMLEETERVVVLFDEFDELVRERGSANSEPFSRLLTTSMLPKLTSIHKRRTLVFIIATNHVSEFDLAIRRRGRFDRVVQVMPPTYQAKVAKHNWGPGKNLDLKGRLDGLKVNLTDDMIRQIEDLTFDECEEFVVQLATIDSSQTAATALAAIWSQCTLQTNVSKEEQNMTWADQCRADAQLSH